LKGLFITFEGPEGSGKSTQVRRLVESLESRGVSVVATFEPGGTPLAVRIRGLLNGQEVADSPDAAGGRVDERTELLLMLAARAHHVQNLIRPALEAGKVVICDRFSDSTFAYQGAGRGQAFEEIERLNTYATGGLEPALTFLMDIDAEVGLDRLRQPNRKLDRFEQ
jgi:dTMP kinase